MTAFSKFSKDEMIEELKAFDPIAFKYYYGQKPEEIKSKIGSISAEAKRYARVVKYEQSQQFSSLTKRNYADDCANLRLVYGEREDAISNINMLELVLNKVISQYINIDGMERLFSETYIEFEWEMHLSADYKKHNMKFYRDHFFHQVRDTYMMYILLRDQGFYECIRKILLDESASKVSRFVCRSLLQQEYQEDKRIKELRRRGDKDFYIRNIIYMACFMAGLFHDIGYPEAYYMTTNKHIKDYIVSVHELNAEGSSLSKIYSLLQNSLLFRVEPFDNIERRISDPHKPEHGALSAIIFLLHFYENGAIYRLPPYKSAAVELAALAIYNHTNEYGILDEEAEYDIYRPCFSLNPISYLLRICDDLQEWDRIYFVISDKSNIVFCNTCKTPIVGYKEYNNGQWITRYRCNCNAGTLEQGGNVNDRKQDRYLQAFDGISKFSYRRIYNVSVCDKLEVTASDSGQKICFKLHYDPYKLLHVAYLNPTYAKYRIKELNKLKKLFECQHCFPQIYMEYFVTSNPIYIKIQILEEYLALAHTIPMTIENVKETIASGLIAFENQEHFDNWLDDKAKDVIAGTEEVSKGFLDGLMSETNEFYCKAKEYLESAKLFYGKLLIYQWVNQYLNNYVNASDSGEQKKKYNSWKKTLLDSEWQFVKPYFEYSELRCMITDCFLQFTRMYFDVSKCNFFPQEYYEQYKNSKREKIFGNREGVICNESKDYYYTALIRYLDAEGYVPILKRKGGEKATEIDAYTDLYLFYLMDQEIKKNNNVK